jgi:hypothetical protein
MVALLHASLNGAVAHRTVHDQEAAPADQRGQLARLRGRRVWVDINFG